MAQPIWITPAGSLGTIPEGVFFQVDLLADTQPVANAVVCTATSSSTNLITCTSTAGLWAGLNVMFSGTVFGGVNNYTRYFVLEVVNSTQFSISATERDTTPIALTTGAGSMTATFNQHVYYNLQSGKLPSGIQVSDNGLIVGIPKAVASLQGVPLDVSQDVISKFTIRAYTEKPVASSLVVDRIAERTFTITVTGQDAPEFITPAGTLGTYFDGTQITDLQVEYTDTDPGELVVISLAAGKLPPGLTISNTGLISGFIAPTEDINQPPGYSRLGQGYNRYAYDFQARIVNYTYEFVLEVSDGKASNLRTYNISVYSRSSMTADTTQFTADNTFITADVTPVRTPILLTPPGSLGRIRSDNFYAFKFDGIDLDGDEIRYVITVGEGIGYDDSNYDITGFDRSPFELPPGLTLDPVSGWLYGYIPDQGLTEIDYQFAIRVAQADDPDIISDYYYFTMTITGAIDTEITWLTDSNLGTINTGSPSLFTVTAINVAGIPLEYRLKSGSASSLPQGLKLLPSGNIAGRVSFDTFALDGNTTVFDVDIKNLSLTQPTTFDREFNFTVEAYGVGAGQQISTFKEFTITINRAYDQPYENLYIQAMPPENDRQLIENLLQNQTIIPSSLLYRGDDPNFGRAQKVVYWHAYGLTSSTYADYVSSLYENHYWKNLVLGSIETAQALDANGNVIYEVVYSKIVDDLVNAQGESVSKEVVIPYPINENDSTEIDTVFPNSLDNMRNQVIDTVGQISNLLPLWMLSKQTDGRVLGFTPSWVIAYTKPGQSKQIQYNIQTQFGIQLNKVDFKVDRYELDRLLSANWDPTIDRWIPVPPTETTFDQFTTIKYQTIDLNTNGRISDITSYLGDSTTKDFSFDNLPTTDIVIVTVNGQIQEYGTDFTITFSPNPASVNFTTAPGVVNTSYLGDGSSEIFYYVPQTDYALEVYVANQLKTIGTDYTVGTNYITLNVTPTTSQTVLIRQRSVVEIYQIRDKYLDDTDSDTQTPTTFDGNSMQFIAPVDIYTNTTDYDKYLVFPKRTILG